MDPRGLAIVENYRAKLDELRAARRAAGLALVGSGMSYRQAAEALGISHVTILRDLGAPRGQLSPQQRGYDAKHRVLRKQEARRVALGGVPCARCGQEIVPGQKWHLDHDDKDRSRYLGPSHERCNVAAGASRVSPARTSSTITLGATPPRMTHPTPQPTSTQARLNLGTCVKCRRAIYDRWTRTPTGAMHPECAGN